MISIDTYKLITGGNNNILQVAFVDITANVVLIHYPIVTRINDLENYKPFKGMYHIHVSLKTRPLCFSNSVDLKIVCAKL